MRVDEALAGRISGMSGGSQRWLKTALQTVLANDEMLGVAEEGAAARRPATPPEREVERETAGEPERRALDLEDVLMGKVDLSERLEEYPELTEELEGLSDIIEMLRETGRRRRERGEDLLREMLDEEPGEEEEPDGGDASSSQ